MLMRSIALHRRRHQRATACGGRFCQLLLRPAWGAASRAAAVPALGAIPSHLRSSFLEATLRRKHGLYGDSLAEAARIDMLVGLAGCILPESSLASAPPRLIEISILLTQHGRPALMASWCRCRLHARSTPLKPPSPASRVCAGRWRGGYQAQVPVPHLPGGASSLMNEIEGFIVGFEGFPKACP